MTFPQLHETCVAAKCHGTSALCSCSFPFAIYQKDLVIPDRAVNALAARMSSETLPEVAQQGCPGRGAYPAGAPSDSTGVSPTEQVWNGFKTSRGLIVSQVYRLNGREVVDIFEEEAQSLTPVHFYDLGLEDVRPDPVSLLPSQRRKVEGWNLQETLRNAFGVLALRPALGELGKTGELKWTTWRTLGQRSTDPR